MQDLKEEIARVAEDLYHLSGEEPGHDLDNWLYAEKLVFSWYAPDAERERHVGEEFPELEDHMIAASEDEVGG